MCLVFFVNFTLIALLFSNFITQMAKFILVWINLEEMSFFRFSKGMKLKILTKIFTWSSKVRTTAINRNFEFDCPLALSYVSFFFWYPEKKNKGKGGDISLAPLLSHFLHWERNQNSDWNCPLDSKCHNAFAIQIAINYAKNPNFSNECLLDILYRSVITSNLCSASLSNFRVFNRKNVYAILYYKIQSVCVSDCLWVHWSGIGSQTICTTVMKLLQVTQWV